VPLLRWHTRFRAHGSTHWRTAYLPKLWACGETGGAWLFLSLRKVRRAVALQPAIPRRAWRIYSFLIHYGHWTANLPRFVISAFQPTPWILKYRSTGATERSCHIYVSVLQVADIPCGKHATLNKGSHREIRVNGHKNCDPARATKRSIRVVKPLSPRQSDSLPWRNRRSGAVHWKNSAT